MTGPSHKRLFPGERSKTVGGSGPNRGFLPRTNSPRKSRESPSTRRARRSRDSAPVASRDIPEDRGRPDRARQHAPVFLGFLTDTVTPGGRTGPDTGPLPKRQPERRGGAATRMVSNRGPSSSSPAMAPNVTFSFGTATRPLISLAHRAADTALWLPCTTSGPAGAIRVLYPRRERYTRFGQWAG